MMELLLLYIDDGDLSRSLSFLSGLSSLQILTANCLFFFECVNVNLNRCCKAVRVCLFVCLLLGNFPFRKQAMPFSRHLENFLNYQQFFCTKLKKIENLYVNTQDRTRNF